jgi:hypothetical protein
VPVAVAEAEAVAVLIYVAAKDLVDNPVVAEAALAYSVKAVLALAERQAD